MTVAEQMARTAWGAMQVQGHPPDALARMLDMDVIDFTRPGTCAAVLRLADRLAATWGDDQAAAARARADGYHPVMAYDDAWELDETAVHDPVNIAVDLTRRRWEIVRRMAEGWSTKEALGPDTDAWCERTMQRFRAQRMTTQPSRYEAFQYAPDETWLVLCDDAEHDPVGSALQHGLIRHQDLPAGHPARLAVAEQARLRRVEQDRARRRAAVPAGRQLAFAV